MSNVSYSYNFSSFLNNKVNSVTLTNSIKASSITKTLAHVDTNNNVCYIWFAAALTAGEQTTLSSIVASHDGSDIPVDYAKKGINRPPSQTDDSNNQVSIGDTWLDTTNQKQYVCVSNTLNNAVWKETTNSSHASTHASGGTDQLNVNNLSGKLANNQNTGYYNNGSFISSRANVNFIPGSNTTIGISDVSASDRVDVTITATGGGSSGLLSAYTNITDGSTTASATNADTIRFRSANNILTTTVGSNDATYGDNVLLTFVPGNVTHSTLGSLTSSDDHTQYVHNTTARTITAVHTFSPGSATAPFILSTNAQGQLVTGLNSDKLDGQDGSYYLTATNISSGTLPAAVFNDTSHGSRSGGTLHSVATTSVAGFMSTVDKAKLDGIGVSAFDGYALLNGTKTYTGNLNIGNYLITNLGTPISSTDAVNKSYVDGYFQNTTLSAVLSKGNTTSGNHINLTGGSYLWSSDGYVLVNDRLDVANGIISTAGDVVLYDNINMGNTYSIINLPTPVNNSDATNKAYVDSKVSTNLGYYFWTTAISNGASDGYQHLVTLPATSTGTLDSTIIEIWGGPWTQYPYAATVYITNRDNYGGYIVSNRGFNNNLKIKTFIQADNTVQVWAHLTSTYQRFNLNITSTNYSSKGALTTVTTYPAGTLLWDSSNTSASYGDVTSNSLTSTDNSLTRFDGTSGKIVQNSLAVLDDTGNLNLNSGAGTLTCGTPTVSGHAATKGYVDGYMQSQTLATILAHGNNAGSNVIDMNNQPIQNVYALTNYVTGQVLLDSILNMNGKALTNLITPTASTDAATKGYVDGYVPKITVQKSAVTIGNRNKINFIEGSNVTITTTDNSSNDSVDVTITSSGSGGSSDGKVKLSTTDTSEYVQNKFYAGSNITIQTKVPDSPVIAEYLFNEATSGNTPAAALDSLGLKPLTYYNKTNDYYLTNTLGTGYNFTSGYAQGSYANFINTQTFTVEMSFIYTSTSWSTFFNIGGGLYNFSMITSGTSILLRTSGIYTSDPDTYINNISNGRHVLHFVFNSTAGNSSTGIKLYLDGVLQGTGATYEGLVPTSSDVLLYGKPEVDYFSIYSKSFTQEEITTRNSQLSITTDATYNSYSAEKIIISSPVVNATTSSAGLMSAADKTKSDQIVNNSHKITISSTQPTSPSTGDIWIVIS